MKLSCIAEGEFYQYPADEAESDYRFKKQLKEFESSRNQNLVAILDLPHDLLRDLWNELDYRGVTDLFTFYANNSVPRIEERIAKYKTERLAKQQGHDREAAQRSKDEPVPNPAPTHVRPSDLTPSGHGFKGRVIRSTDTFS